MSIQSRASAAVLTAAALALAATGCGGEDKQRAAAAKPVAKSPAAPAGAGKAYAAPATAGAPTTAQQQPSGTPVAKSDFDLTKDGFAFENYGRSTPAMRVQEVVETFGKQVCIDPSAGTCVLTPEAERWRIMLNQAIANGHCYGFSTLALALKRGVVTPADYGGGVSTFDLRIADGTGHVTNPDLDADLTRDAAIQTVSQIESKTLKLSPNEVLQRLRTAFANGDNDWVMSFFQPGDGGHAVVPIAIEDMGGGKFDILLYDNNFPYIPTRPETSVRRFHIDTTRDRWDYTISVRPDVPADQWSGTGKKVPIKLVRSADQTIPQPCPFCGRSDAPTGPGLGTGAARPMTQIVLTGDATRHGHLVITDGDGNKMGWDGTHFVNTIPGARLVEAAVIRRQFADPEPFFEVPAGATYRIELVDVPAGAPPATVHVSGPGLGVGLSRLTDGGSELTVAANGAVSVDQANTADVAPLLKVAVAGDREVTIVPDSDKVRLAPAGGDDLKITGEVKRATAKNPETGKTKQLDNGKFDLSNAVGTTG